MVIILLQLKEERAKQMADPHGTLRLLIATEAFGMGVDCPDIENVIHVGPPTTLESERYYGYLKVKYFLCMRYLSLSLIKK